MILGASGMSGHVISYYLRESGFTVDTIAGKNTLDKDTILVDVLDLNKLKDILRAEQYDVVINCIALLVKDSEEKSDEAIYINSFLPHFLERYYKKSKTKIIHISTDDVFSFISPPYQEESAYDGKSFYGRTKALGELINNKDLTLRTSIVGPALKANGSGLFNWFYIQKGEVPGYTTAIWNGVTTIELAKGIKAAIDQNLTGLYHFVPKNNISKFDLLKLFEEIFNKKDVNIKPIEGLNINKTLINTRKDFDYQISNYKTMVNEMSGWIKNHPKLYGHYEK